MHYFITSIYQFQNMALTKTDWSTGYTTQGIQHQNVVSGRSYEDMKKVSSESHYQWILIPLHHLQSIQHLLFHGPCYNPLMPCITGWWKIFRNGILNISMKICEGANVGKEVVSATSLWRYHRDRCSFKYACLESTTCIYFRNISTWTQVFALGQ